jgi:hypothetical protein
MILRIPLARLPVSTCRMDRARGQGVLRCAKTFAKCWPTKNSEVFHRADCKSAAKISAKNVVKYATRDEAIQAGKKPCAECKP